MVIFKRILILLVLLTAASIQAQNKDTIPELTMEDSLQLIYNDSTYFDLDTMPDTIFYEKFVPYDKTIYRNSLINLRKTLTASKNPPIRENLNNYGVAIWAAFIALLIIYFKNNFALQYRLLNKAWFSTISFNEFFSTQTSVFKNSKILTWFIISQAVSLGIYIIIKSNYDVQLENPYLHQLVYFYQNNLYISGYKISDIGLAIIISLCVVLLFIANQWLKNVFAYSFYQPSLSKDYAIIYRINSYISSLFLIPVLLLIYYNGDRNLKTIVISAMVFYILIVYSSSLVKFIFSGRFLQNQSNFILILYLCAFEILPLLVLIKSINNLLEYD